MDAFISKIGRNGLLGDILNIGSFDVFSREFEPSVVGGEPNHPSWSTALEGLIQDPYVVTLGIERAIHAFAVGKSRRVDDDQVKLLWRRLFQPL